MDIMELRATGELVGGVAVLGTLLYLAVQVKHGNDFARDDASRVWTDYNFDLAGRVATDRDLAEIW